MWYPQRIFIEYLIVLRIVHTLLFLLLYIRGGFLSSISMLPPSKSPTGRVARAY